jgi:RimJ/RimL family protein N-acetyltransferase
VTAEGLVLEGRLVRLEPLTFDHVPALVVASAESREHYGYNWVPDGEADVVRYVADALEGQRVGDELAFAQVRVDTGQVVGSTRYYDMKPWQWPAGSLNQRFDTPDAVEIGYTWLAASAQRTGINTEAKFLLLQHAFETWQVHRVSWRTDARNERSRAAIERLGAQFEGIRRAERPGADGTVRDSAYYSVIAAEWPTVRARLIRLLNR